MQKPMKKRWNSNRRTADFKFAYQYHPNGEYYVRGGICWPELDDGYALMGAQNISDGKVYIFEETSFFTVENVIGPGQTFERLGLSYFFNNWRDEYFCTNYFYCQDEDHHKKFYLQILRCPMVPEPKPYFFEVPFSEHFIIEYYQLKKLIFDEDSELYNQLEIWKNDNKERLPAVHALGCLLAGYTKYPFYRHHEEEDHRRGFY